MTALVVRPEVPLGTYRQVTSDILPVIVHLP
uniref:Uncharacterized protein n=1 Tax=Anguilla anguilla TaxID=7936 RepID=A0A0E9PV02_ANGAN